MFNLGEFLNVAGSGERIKIGIRSKNGFMFDDKVLNLRQSKVQAIYDYPIYNIYTFNDKKDSGMTVILNDIIEE